MDLISAGKGNPYRDWFNSGKLIGVSADGLTVKDFQKGMRVASVSRKKRDCETVVNIKWAHPSGMEVDVNYFIFSDTDVIE